MLSSYQRLAELDLPGKVCITSRVHPPKEVVRPQNFSTLHRLSGIVLKYHDNPHDLAGYTTYDYVREALELVFAQPFSHNQVLPYYYAIRKENNLASTTPSALTQFEEVFSCYKFILYKDLDWERSLKWAKNYLESGKITGLSNRFNFDYLVLVEAHLLLLPNNFQAFKFFNSLCNWLKENTNCQVITINDQTGLIQSGPLQMPIRIRPL